MGRKLEAATQRHRLVLTPAGRCYHTALKQDTMGGLTSLHHAARAFKCQFKEWLGNVSPYISNFAGLMYLARKRP